MEFSLFVFLPSICERAYESTRFDRRFSLSNYGITLNGNNCVIASRLNEHTTLRYNSRLPFRISISDDPSIVRMQLIVYTCAARVPPFPQNGTMKNSYFKLSSYCVKKGKSTKLNETIVRFCTKLPILQ